MLSGKLRYFSNKTNLNIFTNKNNIFNTSSSITNKNTFSKVNNFGFKYMRKLRKRKKFYKKNLKK